MAVSQQLDDHKTEQVFMIKSLSLKFLESTGHLTGTRRSNSDLIQTQSYKERILLPIIFEFLSLSGFGSYIFKACINAK